jgi:outer membrane protein, multidrug efflux system
MISQFPFGAPPLRRHRLGIAGVLLCALTACSLAPTHERPSLVMPRAMEGEEVPRSSTAASPVELNLSEVDVLTALGGDTDLQQWLAESLSRNIDYRRAGLHVQQARSMSSAQRADRFPTVVAGVQYARNHFDIPALSERFEQRLATAGLSIGDFEPDLFGRIASMTDAARARFVASEHGRNSIRGQTAAELLRACALYGASEEALALQESIRNALAEAARARFKMLDVGLAATSDADEARKLLREAEEEVSKARAERESMGRALRLLSGGVEPPRARLRLWGSEGTYSAGTASWSDIPSEVLLHRPDVQYAEATLKAANADIGAARAAFFPSIRLSTSHGVASEKLGYLFSHGAGTWSFTPQIDIPIFDFGRRQANLDLAWARQQEGVLDYEATVQLAFKEAADALAAREVLLEAQERAIEQETKALGRLARIERRASQRLSEASAVHLERVRATRATLVRVDVQRSLLVNRIALFRALYGTPSSKQQQPTRIP